MTRPIIVWLRRDLRLADNRAIIRAASAGAPVIPLFILDDATPGKWRAGGAGRWWLHHSLDSLDKDLHALGSRLVLARGKSIEVLPKLAAECDAAAVFASRAYEPWAGELEYELRERLADSGTEFRRFAGTLLFEPEAVKTKDGGPFKVYTPFWRAATAAVEIPAPEPPPQSLMAPREWPASDQLASWSLLPEHPDWAAGMRESWTPGENGAKKRLSAFLSSSLASYGEDRNRPDREATSRLSPHLAFGEISPATIWHAAAAALRRQPKRRAGYDVFCKELVWREFSYHLLSHFPAFPEQPFRPEFTRFPWNDAPGLLRAWQRGKTGYPIVDAGMRELWHTGFMHNRVRMIVASFLVKDLAVPWQAGEAWFWNTLVDADLANNAVSWQWVAGCGADAAPYFRVFNPVLQGAKFDPQGAYVRRWVPELARLPDDRIHKPWEASPMELRAAGIDLGRTYPHPVVDHSEARDRALAAFKALKG